MNKYGFRLENGEDGLLISSFMQKFIREGRSSEAYIQGKQFLPKYKKYVAKRLRQCLPEEIGLANVGIYASVHMWCNELIVSMAKEHMEELLKKIVFTLSLSPKNKWTDLSWIFHKFHPKMKTYLVKTAETCETLQDYLSYLLSHFQDIKATYACLKELSELKDNGFLLLIGEAIVKNAQSTSCKGLGCWLYLAAQVCVEPSFAYPKEEIQYGDLDFDENVRVQIPDYFFDMHTLQGKKLKRGQVHWFESCCRVNHYVHLASDFRYDPLKYGLNVDGVQNKGGIQMQHMILPGGISEHWGSNYK